MPLSGLSSGSSHSLHLHLLWCQSTASFRIQTHASQALPFVHRASWNLRCSSSCSKMCRAYSSQSPGWWTCAVALAAQARALMLVLGGMLYHHGITLSAIVVNSSSSPHSSGVTPMRSWIISTMPSGDPGIPGSSSKSAMWFHHILAAVSLVLIASTMTSPWVTIALYCPSRKGSSLGDIQSDMDMNLSEMSFLIISPSTISPACWIRSCNARWSSSGSPAEHSAALMVRWSSRDSPGIGHPLLFP